MDASDKDEGFEWAIGLNRLSLELIGVWRKDDSQRVSVLAPSLAVFLLLGLTFPQMHALAKVHRHLSLVIDNLISLCPSISAAAKIVILWTGRREIAALLRQVRGDWLAGKSPAELRSMRLQARRARGLTIAGCAATAACLAGFLAMPMLRLSFRERNNITDPHPRRYMPFQCVYLYDAYESPAYELTYLQQMLASGIAAFLFCVPENFFGALVFHACAQCQMLEVRFERLAASAAVLDSTFVVELRRAVSRHVRLVRFVDDIEELFNVLILAHMLFFTSTIGFTGFALLEAFGKDAESPPLVQVVTLSATTTDMLLLTLIYCGTGEMLTTSSCRLLEATYLPCLHSIPKSRARDLAMIMMRSRVPLKLTAGKCFDLSLNTYLQLVKNSVGYISMLITVNQ